MPIRAQVAVVAALAIAIAVAAVLAPGGSERRARTAPAAAAGATDVRAEVGKIAARVEALRGLRFKHVPRVRLVTPATARREGLADLSRSQSAAREAVDTELLELLGLLPAGSDLRQIAGSVYDQQVAGYYDPRTKRLSVVVAPRGGARAAGGALAEITLAHELTHALEDQRFGLGDESSGTDDASSARQALVEGTATEIMTQYAQRYLASADTLGDAVSGLTAGGQTTKLPPYVMSSLVFPYIAGQQFVEALRRLGGGWALVNLALRSRPPRSTAQIIHPLEWVRGRGPLAVSLPGAAVLGRRWRVVATGGMGEFDTDELLKLANAPLAAGNAAAGWRGGRYALFRRGPLPARGCGRPCPARDALVLRWRWATARDQRQFEAAASRYVTRRGPSVGAIELVSGVGSTTIALAPSAGAAQRLAAAG